MNKKTTQLEGEQDPSHGSVNLVEEMEVKERESPTLGDSKWKKKLSKKDSIFYRPSEVDNKVLESAIAKVDSSKGRKCQKICDTKSISYLATPTLYRRKDRQGSCLQMILKNS